MNNSKQHALDNALSQAVINVEVRRVSKFLKRGANVMSPCYADKTVINRAPNIISYAIKVSDYEMFKLLFKSLESVDCNALFKYAVDHVPHCDYIISLHKKTKNKLYHGIHDMDTRKNYKHLAYRHLKICSYILTKAQGLSRKKNQDCVGPIRGAESEEDTKSEDTKSEDTKTEDTKSEDAKSEKKTNSNKETNLNEKVKSNKKQESEIDESSEQSFSSGDIGEDIEGELYKEIMRRKQSSQNTSHNSGALPSIKNTVPIETGISMYAYMKLSANLDHDRCFRILPKSVYHNNQWNQKVLQRAIIRNKMKVIEYLIVQEQLLNKITDYKRILELSLKLDRNDVLNMCLKYRKD